MLPCRFEPIHRGARIARRLDHFELSTDPAGELSAKYGLGQEVADPKTHPLSPRIQIVARSDHDDWNFGSDRIAPERLDHLETVHPRHHQVEQNHIDFVFMY